jgi:hypothetical protein
MSAEFSVWAIGENLAGIIRAAGEEMDSLVCHLEKTLFMMSSCEYSFPTQQTISEE